MNFRMLSVFFCFVALLCVACIATSGIAFAENVQSENTSVVKIGEEPAAQSDKSNQATKNSANLKTSEPVSHSDKSINQIENTSIVNNGEEPVTQSGKSNQATKNSASLEISESTIQSDKSNSSAGNKTTKIMNDKKSKQMTDTAKTKSNERRDQKDTAKTNENTNECKVLVTGYNKYTGSCVNGLANGVGVAKGVLGIYEGHFKNGYFHGEGKLTDFLDGSEYQGKFQKGQRQGEFRIFDVSSGYLRLALFQNDQFVKWLDKVSPEIKYSGNNTEQVKTITTQADKHAKQNYSRNAYIGMATPYGEIVAFDANTFTTETRTIGSDGYDRVKRQKYPMYLLK